MYDIVCKPKLGERKLACKPKLASVGLTFHKKHAMISYR